MDDENDHDVVDYDYRDDNDENDEDGDDDNNADDDGDDDDRYVTKPFFKIKTFFLVRKNFLCKVLKKSHYLSRTVTGLIKVHIFSFFAVQS